MPKVKATYKCDTVGDLLDRLAEIAKDPELWDLMGATIEGAGSDFNGFRIVERTLSDKSKVLDFELIEG